MATQSSSSSEGEQSISKNSKPDADDLTNEKLQNHDTIDEDDEDSVEDASKQRYIELEEEKKLKAKYPAVQRPGSQFLQKRLQRGQKYFDSGDYNMAKASKSPDAKLPEFNSPVQAIDNKTLGKRI